MSKIYEPLKNLISQDMLEKASILVEENEAKISKAVSAIIPSFLAVLLKSGNTPKTMNILEEAGNLNILSGAKNIFETGPTQEQQKLGDDFLQRLLGDKAALFTQPIAEHAGISKVAANKLISMIAPIVTGFLGNKLVKENWSLQTILDEIKKEKDNFVSLIPNKMISDCDLSSALRSAPVSSGNVNVKKESGKSKSWLVWLIAAILLILLLLFAWRSCNKPQTAMEIKDTAATVTDTIKAKSERIVEDVKAKVSTVLELPNGIKLNAYKGGIEDEMISFLKSDNYKNATEEELKDKWFNFDNIDFLHGSSTELTKESYPQLDNIVEILKYYKGTKIKIGGYTDKTGSEETNMKISQERANTIKAYFEKGGIDAKSLTAEGYGDKFAKYSSDAPDSDRVKDRKISLRFVK